MNLLSWIIIGGLAGWVASMVVGTEAEQGILGNIVVGVIGALIGGFLVGLFGGANAGITGFNIVSFLVALLGSVVLIWILKAVRGSSTGGV